MVRILVVDVNMTTSYRIKKLIKSESIELHTASTQMEAINRINTISDVDMVIIDVKLGADDGFQTIEQIKKNHKELMVVILTGLNTRRDFVHGLKVGASDYVLKPYDNYYFKEKLLSHIEDIEKYKNIPDYAPRQIDQAVYKAVREAIKSGYELIIGLIILYHKDVNISDKSNHIKDMSIMRSLTLKLEDIVSNADNIHAYGSSGIVVILPKKSLEQKEEVKETFDTFVKGYIQKNQIDDTYIASQFLSLPSEVDERENALAVLAKNMENFLK